MLQPQRLRAPSRSMRPTTALLAALLAVFATVAWRIRPGSAASYGGLAGALLLLVGLLVSRWRRFHPFGPMFVYDVVRTARSGQTIGHRCFYVVLLLATLLLSYWVWSPAGDWRAFLFQGVSFARGKETSQFANWFFGVFMVVQLVVLLLITPLYTACAISDERERRTLDFMLTTDLSDAEIVLGILGARLANLLMLAVAALPFVSFLPFLGGVDPSRVVLGFLAAGATVLGLGSLSILCSVVLPTTLRAVGWGYFWAVLLYFPVAGLLANTLLGGAGPELSYLVAYFLFQAVITVVCASWAVTELRSPMLRAGELGVTIPPPHIARARPIQAVDQTAAIRAGQPRVQQPQASQASSWERSLPPLPPIGTNALLWKELYAPGSRGSGTDRGARIPIGQFGAGLILIVGLFCLLADVPTDEVVQSWVRGLGTTLICLMLLGIALSAATRISGERERQTLDGLRVVPVSASEILFAKWLASIMSVRWLWWPLGALWLLGVVTGGLSAFAVPWLIAACMVYAGFVSVLGLLFSLLNRTNLRASLATLLVGLVFICGPGAFYRAVYGDIYYNARFGTHQIWDLLITDCGLTPPVTLTTLAFRPEDLLGQGKPADTSAQALDQLLAALVGLEAYLALTVLLCAFLRRRFEGEKGPEPTKRPA